MGREWKFFTLEVALAVKSEANIFMLDFSLEVYLLTLDFISFFLLIS